MSTPKIQMYASDWCPYCSRARRLLHDKGVPFEEIDVDTSPEARAEMVARSGSHTVPQIFIDGVHIGGCDDLLAREAAGTLDPLINPRKES
jgi:glutaredoxin 3